MLDSIRDKEIFKRIAHPPRLEPEMRAKVLAEVTGRLKLKAIGPWLKAGLSFDEAYLLGMYEPHVAEADLARYVGRIRQTKLHLACNNDNWFAAANDKGLYYTILKGAGFAVPEPMAFAGVKRREGLGAWLGSAEALGAFLSANKIWPLFAKPVDGMFSLGAMRILGMDGDLVNVHGHEPVRVPELWAYMLAMSQQGYLLQRCLNASAFAKSHFGDVIATARLLVLFSGPEPQLESAVLKIPCGEHVADNFWRPGNMLAALDGEGRIGRVITGKGAGRRVVERHPLTGVEFAGLQIPEWPDMLRTTLAATCLLPGVRTQSWDVALTEGGTHLLEVNFGGDLDLHQIAHQRGIISESYKAHLLTCGAKLKGL